MRIPRIDVRTATAAVLAGVMAAMAPVGLSAAEHVVPAEALTRQLESESATRAANEQALRALFEASSETLESAGLDAEQAVAGVAALDDAELSRLAERARAFQAEVAAGALNNQQITYILIALGTAIVVLLIVGRD